MTVAHDHEDLLAELGVPTRVGRRAMVPLAAILDGPVEEALRKQVGPAWRGLDAMSDEGRSVVEALVRWTPDAGDARGACDEAARRHAYETGVVLALATACPRPGGAQALGLPPVRDPALRAILASRGRNVVLPEAFGPVAQWLAERTEGRPLPGLALTVASDVLRDECRRMRPARIERLGRLPAWSS